jgi:hypothetical protein
LSKEDQRRRQESAVGEWLKAFQGDFYKIDSQQKTRQLLKEPNPPFGKLEVESARGPEPLL